MEKKMESELESEWLRGISKSKMLAIQVVIQTSFS